MSTISTYAALALLQGGGGLPMSGLLFNMVAIFAIFYFLMIRPQQKQKKQHEARLLELKRGDEIVTTGGIIGEVLEVKKGLKDGAPVATLDDRLTIKSGDARLIIERGRVARVITPVVATTP